MPFDGSDPTIAKLSEAQRLLRAHGWMQGAATDEFGRHCLVSAIGRVYGGISHTPLEISKALHDEARARGGSATRLGAVDWNDKVAKSVEEVIDFIERVKGRL